MKEETNILLEEIEEYKIDLYENFVESIARKFKNTKSFSCLGFVLDCCMDLKGSYIAYVLIAYYNFVESTKKNRSILELCRYRKTYKKLQNLIKMDKAHAEQIKFVALN